jgi:4,5-dihydroxyphthalate decarboxylase
MALGLDQDPPKDVDIKWLPGGVQLGEMLVNGEIDAMFPDSSTQLYNAPNVKRLFSDGGKAFIADFAHHRGFTPVNHTLVVQRRVVDEHPWVPEALYEAFEKSKQEAFRRDRSTSMLFKGDDYEEQATLFGADPYPSGLSVNRKMLQRGMEQSLTEGMLKKSLDIDALYAESLRGT